MSWKKVLKFNRQGLVPAIIQDYRTGEVLMLAYMNRTALKKTLASGKVHFYSRSRKKLWLKGEDSGNLQILKSIYFDCDCDTLLLKVRQLGGACHTGYRSCFYRKVFPGEKITIECKRVFDPRKAYKK